VVNRFYGIPEIPEVNAISVEHIRSAVYMPTNDINENNTYSSSDTDINDLDFVTVSADFDMVKLYDNFFANFASEQVKEDWRDPCLAIPVFAAVELQRQQKLEDGSWTDWQVVPRTKIDLHKTMFTTVEDAAKLPVGGIGVHLVEYSEPLVQMDIIQPGIYDIASPQEQWFPPDIHKKYTERQQKAAERQRKIKLAEEKEERDSQRKEKKSEQANARKSLTPADSGGRRGGGAGGPPGGGLEGYTAPGMEGVTSTREVKEKQTMLEKLKESEEITFDDIYNDFDAIQLDLDKVKDIKTLGKLVFWAHDDTVVPGATYRYRTRIGVFNPVAGTDQFKDEYKSRKNEVVLWSGYSPTSEAVEIPLRLYFYAQSTQETAKTVTVRVFKYNLGYWYFRDFIVRAGELIGKVVEKEISETKAIGEEPQKTSTAFELPEKVDYSTGAMMVDVVAVKDWGGSKVYSARPHWEMLYTFDTTKINRMSVGSKYWLDQERVKYNELQRLEKEEKIAYLPRSTSKTETRDTYKPVRNQGNPMTPGDLDPVLDQKYLPPGSK
ncbi:MAG TPA: hypothetical protein PLP05_08445, partial [Sedimentisphaerales bacterium]|nr:hypothetical protein [Sedimentisphaerales bacterium]